MMPRPEILDAGEAVRPCADRAGIMRQERTSPVPPPESSAPMSSPAPTQLSLMRLLQLASPTLPVGAYSYSQGLEWAVGAGTVRDAATAAAWIEDVLRFSMGTFELACLTRMLAAARAEDACELERLNAGFLAGRESAELRAETVQMGRSLVRLLRELPETGQAAALVARLGEPTYPAAWACAAAAFRLDDDASRAAYAWSWLENQVLAAVKLVPLGQSAGQRMLLDLARVVAEVCDAPRLDQTQWRNFAPGLGMACSAHETQYTRLFRS